MRIGILLAVLLLAYTASAEQPSHKSLTVRSEDVCGFIEKSMNAATPQVPTLCAPKHGNSSGLQLSVFSPTYVLEGKMRRAWSTALFIALGELYFGNALNGACEWDASTNSLNDLWFGCEITVSDSYLAQNGGKRYQVSHPRSLGPDDPLHSDPSSDQWYRRWWSTLETNQQFDLAGSTERSASSIEAACARYIQDLQRDPITQSKIMPIPRCSVLLATDKRAYILISFPDGFSQDLVNYEYPLVDVFGRVLDNLPYAGAVVFKGSWFEANGKVMRPFWSYDLHDLQFLWEEQNSGVRIPDPLAVAHTRSSGQTDRDSVSNVASYEVLVTVAPAPGGGRFLDFSDGSRFSISPTAEANAKCTLNPGMRMLRDAQGNVSILDGICRDFKIDFVGAW